MFLVLSGFLAFSSFQCGRCCSITPLESMPLFLAVRNLALLSDETAVLCENELENEEWNKAASWVKQLHHSSKCS